MLWKFSTLFGALILVGLFLYYGSVFANGGSPRVAGEKTLIEQEAERQEKLKEPTKEIVKESAVEEKQVQETKKAVVAVNVKSVLIPCRNKSTIVARHYGFGSADSGIWGSSGAGLYRGGWNLPPVTETIHTCN